MPLVLPLLARTSLGPKFAEVLIALALRLLRADVFMSRYALTFDTESAGQNALHVLTHAGWGAHESCHLRAQDVFDISCGIGTDK